MRDENGKAFSRKLLTSNDDIGKRVVVTLANGHKLHGYLSGESVSAIDLQRRSLIGPRKIIVKKSQIDSINIFEKKRVVEEVSEHDTIGGGKARYEDNNISLHDDKVLEAILAIIDSILCAGISLRYVQFVSDCPPKVFVKIGLKYGKIPAGKRKFLDQIGRVAMTSTADNSSSWFILNLDVSGNLMSGCSKLPSTESGSSNSKSADSATSEGG